MRGKTLSSYWRKGVSWIRNFFERAREKNILLVLQQMFFVFNLFWYTKDPIKGNPAEKAAEAWMVCGMSFQKKKMLQKCLSKEDCDK